MHRKKRIAESLYTLAGGTQFFYDNNCILPCTATPKLFTRLGAG